MEEESSLYSRMALPVHRAAGYHAPGSLMYYQKFSSYNLEKGVVKVHQ